MRAAPLMFAAWLILFASAVSAQPGGVVVRYGTNNNLVLHEPVIVVFTVDNGLDVPITFDLGFRQKGHFRITVTPPGRPPLQLAPLDESGFGVGGNVSVAATQGYSQRLLLNEWYDFRQEGKYQIDVALPVPIRANGGTVTSSSRETFELTIEPPDPTRLGRTCRALLASATSSPSYEEQADAALALSYVVDPVAVPFLRELLTALPRLDAIVFEGLRRIGSPDAQAVLDEASRSSDPNRAALAKDAIRRIPTRR
jgi:hypothetical protein